MKATIKWYNKSNPIEEKEGKGIEYQNENEVKEKCKCLNKKYPKLHHFYQLEEKS